MFTFFAAHVMDSRYRLLLRCDAVAPAAYAVFDAYNGIAVTGSPVVAVITGTMTAATGGILRDVVAGEPSVILCMEPYITPTLTGALV